jgi:hypothetical protein
MKPEDDVYTIDSDPTPEIYILGGADNIEEQFSQHDDLDLLANPEPVVLKKTVASCRDDRKSLRNTVPEDRQSCELKMGATLSPAMLLDESRGGFSVLVESREGIKTGRCCKLHTDAGWFKVRVVYIKEAARPRHLTSGSECWFRLGLRKARSFFLF